MAQRLFIVDTEASGKTPHSGVMTEFGVVDFTTRSWFHGHLWDFEPHPDIPALPVPTGERYGFTATLPGEKRKPFDGERVDIDILNDDPATRLFMCLNSWLWQLLDRDESPTFVSDNPGFDFQWMAFGFDKTGVDNPFGYSSRRIGDLAAGLSGNWRKTSAWKNYRRTVHDHNPVNDALGNAEALHTLLTRHDQKI